MDRELGKPHNKEVVTDSSELDVDVAKLNEIIVRLGFKETPELAEARRAVLAAYAEEAHDPDRIGEAWQAHIQIGEAIINEMTGTPESEHMEDRTRLHIALVIYEALTSHEAGGVNFGYATSIRYAIILANTAGYQDVIDNLTAILDRIDPKE